MAIYEEATANYISSMEVFGDLENIVLWRQQSDYNG